MSAPGSSSRSRIAVAALLSAAALALAAAPAAAARLTLDSESSSSDVRIEVAYLGQSGGQTQAMPFTGSVRGDVEDGLDVADGSAATSFTFVEGAIHGADTTYSFPVGGLFDVDVAIFGMNGVFSHDLLAGTPDAADHSALDLTGLELLVVFRQMTLEITPPGGPIDLDPDVFRFPFAMDRDRNGDPVAGEILTLPGAGVRVTIPMDQLASVTQEGVTVTVDIAGDFVFEGSLVDVPALALPARTLLAALLIAAGAVIGSRPHRR